jgi:hypothetical protein
MKRIMNYCATLVVASLLVVSTSVADDSESKDNQGAVRGLVRKALDAIDSESARIQIVGRALRDGENDRLHLLASARQQLQTAVASLKQDEEESVDGDQPVKDVVGAVTKGVKNLLKRDKAEGDSAGGLISKALGILKRDKGDEGGVIRKSLSRALKILKRENKGDE